MRKKSLKAASEDGKSKNLTKSDDPKTFEKYLDAIPGNHVKSNQEFFAFFLFVRSGPMLSFTDFFP
jgi:hypothetical protein